MAMLMPSQSHSGSGSLNPYTGNFAQELQFLTGENRKKTPTPFLDRIATRNTVISHYTSSKVLKKLLYSVH